MAVQYDPKLPVLYTKYRTFAEGALSFLKKRMHKGVQLFTKQKSKVVFGEGDSFTVTSDNEASYYRFISDNEEDIKKLPGYTECEDEVKKHPNYRNTFGMTTRTFFAELVEKTKSLDFNELTFNEVYADFENFLLTLETSNKLHALVSGFSMAPEVIVLGPDIKIKKMTADELAETIDNTSYFDSKFEVMHCRYRIEINYKTKENVGPGKNPHVEAIDTIKKIISALRLFKCGDVCSEFYYYFPISWTIFARGIASSSNPSIPARARIRSELKIENSDIENFKVFWNCYKEIIPKLNNFLFLNTAINRLNFAYDNTRVEDRLIDYMIAFEAMFLKGSEKQELTYRLALRTAVLLSEPSGPREEIFKNMKIAYRLRSLVVHGKIDTLQQELESKHKSINEFIIIIEEYLRASIKKFMELIKTYPSQEAMIDYLDDTILH